MFVVGPALLNMRFPEAVNVSHESVGISLRVGLIGGIAGPVPDSLS